MTKKLHDATTISCKKKQLNTKFFIKKIPRMCRIEYKKQQIDRIKNKKII